MHLDITQAVLNVLLLWILTAPHEFSHAWVATRLGDDTPRLQGRVTLNPLAHVDWLGTAILPFFTSLIGGGFIGWGRPVITNPNKLRGGLNGLALVSIAGPASNVVMAVILAAVAVGTLHTLPAFAQFASRGVVLSLYLAILNMLPIPPLDGSKLLLAARIPMVVYQELARAGFLLLILAISVTSLGARMNEWAYQAATAIFAILR
ncbi:MAG TPA: site-2 protease family protein [Bryobacteraceae bacterium]|nr:site-2 protease family protein [Bryobacteraceae bacterium]